MADNLTAPLPSGTPIATDEIGGVHFPRTKLSIGPDGTAVDVSSANPLPATIVGNIALAGGTTVAISGKPNVAIPDGITGTVSISGTPAVTVSGKPTVSIPDGVVVNNTVNVNPVPCVIAYAIVPSDTVALDPQPSGIFVGTGGNVTIRPAGASADVTYKNVADGGYIAVKVSHVRAAGTTAADLVGEV